ncbi:MAG: hypothetical protein FJ206_03005 [Gemmatimonadetes bacterium]|nr:hypothetical protein [Gemmatimonadota bacterium]
MIAFDGTTTTTVQWAAGGLTASLLRALGTGHLDAVCSFVDRVRDAVDSDTGVFDGQRIREHFHHEAHAWLLAEYRLRLMSRLDDPFQHDRVLATLWATNGALRPALSDALLLRTAIGASEAAIGQLTAARPTEVAGQLRQAIRRVRAFGLEIKAPPPLGLDGRFRVALGRIDRLLARAGASQPASPATSCLCDLSALMRARMPRLPRRRAG